MTYSAKKLEKTELEKLQNLEKKLGYCLVAWEKTPKIAHISDEQLNDIKSTEKEMDAVLVAYDCK